MAKYANCHGNQNSCNLKPCLVKTTNDSSRVMSPQVSLNHDHRTWRFSLANLDWFMNFLILVSFFLKKFIITSVIKGWCQCPGKSHFSQLNPDWPFCFSSDWQTYASKVIYNVWNHIFHIGPEMSPVGGDKSISLLYK